MPRLEFSVEAKLQLEALESDAGQAKRLKAVRAALGKLETNPRHPGLNAHKFKGTSCPHGGELFEVYAQNNTPGAFRIFWCYAPPPPAGVLLVVAITDHP